MLTVTALVTDRCNRRCPYCIGKCNKGRGVTDLSLPLLELWLERFTPNCDLHISGGEPLLINELACFVEKAIVSGHRVTIFTNGDHIIDRPELLELPVLWHVTHHAPTSIDLFLKNIAPIVSNPHIVTRVKHGKEALNKTAELENAYKDLNFHWSVCSGPRMVPSHGTGIDITAVASNVIHMIDCDGTVYPCSTKKHGTIGNVYDMAYDKTAALKWDRTAMKCVESNRCSAFQSAILAKELHRELQP